MNRPTLFITVGYPGSGKSYFAERFARDQQVFYLRADALRLAMFDEPKYTSDEHRLVFRTMDFFAEQLLSQGISVLYDANFNKKADRIRKQQLAARHKANYQLMWVKTPEDLALRRLSERMKTSTGDVVVTPEVFKRFQANLEPPLALDEPFVEIDGRLPYEEQIKQRITRP